MTGKTGRRTTRTTAPWWIGSLALLLGGSTLLTTSCGGGTSYPHRPILLVCPWAAGGGTDRVARQLAILLEQDLKVPVNVQNVTGGEGVTGHTHGSQARPDGYTWTLMTVEINMLRWRGLTKISHHDFTPAVLLNRDAAAVFVRKDAGWKTLKDLEAAVRLAPGRVKASGTAQGAIWHLATAGWLKAVGLPPSHVIWQSIAGAAPSLKELMAGGVDFVCCSLPEARTLVDAGEVRCLGVMAPERLPLFPQVPTFREQGVNWTLDGWRGVGLPRGTPREVTRTAVAALERVARSEAFVSALKTSGFNPACEPPAEFQKTLERTDAQMRSLLTSEDFRGMARKSFGPMFFPTLLGMAGGLVAVGLAASGGFRREAAPLTREATLALGGIVLWVVIYLLLADALGFLLTCGLLLFVTLWRMGNRPAVAAAVTLGIVPGTYLLFAVALRVPLPRGLIG